MEKIKLKIKLYTLICVCDLYDATEDINNTFPERYHFEKPYKSAKNIIDILMIKLQKKRLDKAQSNKVFSLDISYYQAYFLSCFILANIHLVQGILERSLLHQFNMEIDQQL